MRSSEPEAEVGRGPHPHPNWESRSHRPLAWFVCVNLFNKPGPAGAQRRRRAKKQMGGFCEESSGMVNRDSVVMVNRETFVVVNRNSQLRVNRFFGGEARLCGETITEQID